MLKSLCNQCAYFKSGVVHTNTFFELFSGDYDVIGDSASKTLSGTLPTELGLLRSWKYIILRECFLNINFKTALTI